MYCKIHFFNYLEIMNIYVGNISWGMNDQDLENLFAEHGTVTSAKIITDRMTNRSRGFWLR